ANFAAKQLELGETVPPAAVLCSNCWWVGSPIRGVGGWVASSNYYFCFTEGKLYAIRHFRWGTAEAHSPPLQETNSAYQFARKKLVALSVDVDKLEKEHLPFFIPDFTSSFPTSGDFEFKPEFKIAWGFSLKESRGARYGRFEPPCPASVV